jgi:hypothetical protein
MAAETTNIIVTTKPISVAQMYLSQLITSLPFGRQLVASFISCHASDVALCEGFRMTAHRDDSACTGAVVRKPPVKECA